MTDNPHIGSSLDDFLTEEGRLEEATDTAIKRVLLWMALTQRRKRETIRYEKGRVTHA